MTAEQDPARRLKIIERKLGEIQLLEERQGRGEEMHPDQITKMGTKAGLLEEKDQLVATLGAADAE